MNESNAHTHKKGETTKHKGIKCDDYIKNMYKYFSITLIIVRLVPSSMLNDECELFI